MKKIFLLILLSMLVSCKSQKDLQQLVTNEVIYQTKYIDRVDSFYTDKWHTIYINGDTIYKVDSIIVYQKQYLKDTSVIHDTIIKNNIQYKTDIIEKKVPQWWPVYITIGTVLLIIGYFFIKNKISL